MAAATFYTISDARFFPGTAALLNSLRLTGNEGDVVVLDRGLHPDQRTRLEAHARLVRIPDEREVHPTIFKAYPRLFEPTGTICLVDADMAVVDSLAPIVERADAGSICVFADHRSHRDRWFAEWSELLELRAPLRRRTYVNAGFVCFSTDRWPELLERWWTVCERIPPSHVFSRFEAPFWAGDQDALNALLLSEVPDGAVELLPDDAEAYPDDLLEAEIVDERTLEVRFRDRRTTILHYALGPKAWERTAWLRVRDDAYVRLLPRLLFGDDVPLRLRRDEVPFWLRPSRLGSAFVTAVDLGHGAVRGAVHALPSPLKTRLMSLRDAAFRRL
jgi:hypothetical protein